MTLSDCIVAALVVIGAAHGFSVGAISQILRSLTWFAAIVVPRYAAAPVARLFEQAIGESFATTYALAFISLGFVTFVVLRVGTWIILRKRRNAEKKGEMTVSVVDRVVGASMGATKAAALCWLLLSGMVLLEKPLASVNKKLLVTESSLYPLVRKHNLVSMMFQTRVDQLRKALPQLRTKAFATSRLASDPRIVALSNQPALREALATGDVTTVLQTSTALSLLNDGDVMGRIEAGLKVLEGAELNER